MKHKFKQITYRGFLIQELYSGMYAVQFNPTIRLRYKTLSKVKAVINAYLE